VRVITSPTRPIAWLVAGHHADRAQVVEDVLRRDGLAADPALRERHVLDDLAVEVVADHQHVQVARRAC